MNALALTLATMAIGHTPATPSPTIRVALQSPTGTSYGVHHGRHLAEWLPAHTNLCDLSARWVFGKPTVTDARTGRPIALHWVPDYPRFAGRGVAFDGACIFATRSIDVSLTIGGGR